MRSRRAHSRIAAIGIGVLGGLLAGGATADGPCSEPILHFVGSHNVPFERAVKRAIDLAARRLGEEGCGAILLEFHDPTGRVLDDRLRERGPGVQDYVGQLFFLDGDRTPLCQSSERLAGSAPGGRFVLICGQRFVRLQREEPNYAAVVLLHEALHTLGLSEDPPSSAEITERVFARCGK